MIEYVQQADKNKGIVNPGTGWAGGNSDGLGAQFPQQPVYRIKWRLYQQ